MPVNAFILKRLSNLWVAICAAWIITIIFQQFAHADTNQAIAIDAESRISLNKTAQLLPYSPEFSDSEAMITAEINGINNWGSEKNRSLNNILNFRHQWFKNRIHNPSNKAIELFIIASEASLQKGDFIVLKDKTVLEHWQLGVFKPFSERPIYHRFYLMPLTIQAGETLTIIWGFDDGLYTKPILLQSQTAYWQHDNISIISDGMYFGAICIISLLIFLLYITNRDPSYLFLYFMVLGNAFYNYCRNGYAFQFLWPDIPDINTNWMLATVNLSTVGGILFYLFFLDLKRFSYNLLYRFSLFYLAVNTIIILLAILDFKSTALKLVIINTLLSTPYLLAVLVHSALRSYRGDLRARYFTFSLLIYVGYQTSLLGYDLITGSVNTNPWIQTRNGEVLLAIALYVSLLLEVRKTQIEKQAALIEAKAKTNFIATMSHELRTPLNGVIGMAQLLNQTEQTSIQKQYSDIIISSGNVLLTLINDILDLTKITEGKLILEEKSFNLDRVVSECTSTFLAVMIEKGLPLSTYINPHTPLILIGDEYRLRQVIFNLLSNAMKFTEKGQINLNISSNTTTGIPDKILLTIEVIDSGIGIEENNIQRIFSEFSQEDASTTRKFGGTGLGLSITSAIVHTMGGDISATSQINKGSTFTLHIPFSVDQTAEQQRIDALKILKGKKLLLISDTENYFNNLAVNLKHHGAEITATTGNSTASLNQLINEGDYQGLIVFHQTDFWQLLAGINIRQLPLIILHLNDLTPNPLLNEWQAKLITLPIPAPIQKVMTSIGQLFQEDKLVIPDTNLTTIPDIISQAPILIAEDNVTNQLVAIGLLKHLGLNATVAENGKIAVDLYKEHRYPIIFMDCEMPIMDGFTASKEILALDEPKKPIIIALTAHVTDKSTKRCLEAGMTQVLHKPVTLQQLHHCLSNLSLEE